MERFNYKIKKTSGCWLWLGNLTGRDKRAYVWFNGATRIAARVIWELEIEPVPEGLCVLHTCDNPSCVKLDHFYLGTQKDNARDRKERGRNKGLYYLQDRGLEGEKNGASKLTEKDVLSIRASKDSEKKLGKLYDVSGSTIGNVKRRKTWKHV